VGPVTLSPCHCVTVSPCHYVAVLPCTLHFRDEIGNISTSNLRVERRWVSGPCHPVTLSLCTWEGC